MVTTRELGRILDELLAVTPGRGAALLARLLDRLAERGIDPDRLRPAQLDLLFAAVDGDEEVLDVDAALLDEPDDWGDRPDFGDLVGRGPLPSGVPGRA